MVHFVYKKVAMVEQFFDIIYSVHVEAAGETQLRGRAGKHCGQKRTYRAVSGKNTKGSSINDVTVLEGEGVKDFVTTVLRP